MKKLITVGHFTKKIIKQFNLEYQDNKPINLHPSRKKHMLKRHGHEFSDFEGTYQKIPEIIQSPDYIGLHPDGKSIQFIKLLEEKTLVAVRLDAESGNVRTMYPLTDNKLRNYINENRMKSQKK